MLRDMLSKRKRSSGAKTRPMWSGLAQSPPTWNDSKAPRSRRESPARSQAEPTFLVSTPPATSYQAHGIATREFWESETCSEASFSTDRMRREALLLNAARCRSPSREGSTSHRSPHDATARAISHEEPSLNAASKGRSRPPSACQNRRHPTSSIRQNTPPMQAVLTKRILQARCGRGKTSKAPELVLQKRCCAHCAFAERLALALVFFSAFARRIEPDSLDSP